MRIVIIVLSVVGLVGCSPAGEVKVTETKSPAQTPKEEAPKADAVAPVPQTIVIPAGTRLVIQTGSELSTESVAAGDAFSGSVSQPVEIGGRIAIPKGAAVRGTITASDDGGRVKGVASLSLRITQVTLDGKRVPVQTGIYTKNAPATKKKDAVKVGIGAGIGAAIGAIAGGGKGAAVGAASGAGAGTAVVLATHGDAAVIEAESLLTFRLAKAVTVEE